MIVFDATKNKAQQAFAAAVFAALQGTTEHRLFAYGGAIRGGKTFVCLALILEIARKFAGFRAHIVRESLPVLKSTTIPSFLKLIPPNWGQWHRYDGDYYFSLPNGSRIYFLGENFEADRDLSKFKGLETNLLFLEQIEELQPETLQKAFERVGSYYLPDDPIPIILTTFNPCQNWVKNAFYDRFEAGTLPETWFYQVALPTDNPFVTAEQWQAWKQMDELQYRRFIEGDWNAVDRTGRFAYNFSRARHVSNLPVDLPVDLPVVWVSFDFNLSPMTAIIAAVDVPGRRLRVLQEYALDEALNVFCRRIRTDWPDTNFTVTGDPAGRAGSVLTRKNASAYTIIGEEMGINGRDFRLLTKAPLHENSYYYCNSALAALDIGIDASCTGLIADLENVKFAGGQIDKSGNKGHLLDCFRYLLHVNWPNLAERGREILEPTHGQVTLYGGGKTLNIGFDNA